MKTFAAMAVGAAWATMASAAIVVAPDGNDAAAGTVAAPVRTLARAQALARAAKADGGAVTVVLRGGAYRITETLKLGAADSGVTWRAADGERPVLTGGRRLTGLKDDGTNGVLVADAKACGCGSFEPPQATGYSSLYGPHEKAVGDGSYHRINGLYCDGRLLTVAREPNDRFLKMDEIVDNDGNVFRATGVPGRFDLSKAVAPDLMAFGYFQWLWADEKKPAEVRSDGTVKLTWEGKDPSYEKWPLKKGYPFYLENARAFVDAPGEWYLDRAAGRVYVLPPKGAGADSEWTLAETSVPFVLVDGATDVRIEGLVFEYGRGDCVRMHNVRRCAFVANVVRNFGSVGLDVEGEDVVICGNVLHTFGYDALRVTGGDRRTLTPSGIRVEANELSDTGNASHTYTPGIRLRGCGTVLANNHFHDIPSSAMRVEGNDHLIVSNLVENVVKESDDQGGSDTFGDPTFGGIVFRHNVWRNIRAHGIGSSMTAGIRFDDAISAMTVEGNRFENCCDGHFGSVQIHAGRFNMITNNLMVGGPGAVSITDWGRWNTNQWRHYVSAPDGSAARNGYFRNVDVNAPVWKRRFPWLQHAADTVCTNTVACNVVISTKDGTVVMRQNGHTADIGNAVFATMPSDDVLCKIPGFTIPPHAEEVGPSRNDCDFARAKANDRPRIRAVCPSVHTKIWPQPAEMRRSADYALTAEGLPVAVLETAKPQNRLAEPHRHPYAFTMFESDGPVTVDVQRLGTNLAWRSVQVLPAKLGARVTVAEGHARFVLPGPCTAVFEPDGRHRALVIMVQPPERDVPKAGDCNVVYVGPGFHRKPLTELASGQTLYLAPGAVLEGGVRATGDNITVRGRGIISGEPWAWQKGPELAHGKRVGHLFDGTGRGLVVKDVAFTSAWEWTVVLSGVTNALVDNVKVLCGRVINDDGIDLCRAQNVTVRNCFVRSQDDCIAPKWWCENLLVTNCTLWVDSANAVRIGYECSPPPNAMRNIRFRDIDILHLSIPKTRTDEYWGHTALLLQAANEQVFEDIVFDGLRVAAPEPGDNFLIARTMPINVGFKRHPGFAFPDPGHIRNVLVRDVTCAGATRPPALIEAADAEHKVLNVRFENVAGVGPVERRTRN